MIGLPGAALEQAHTPCMAVDVVAANRNIARVTAAASRWSDARWMIAAPAACPAGYQRDTAIAYSRPCREVATLSVKSAKQLAARGRHVPRCEARASS